MYVNVDVEIDADDVLDAMSDEEIMEYLNQRRMRKGKDALPGYPTTNVGMVFEELRRGVIGAATRDYIYQEAGRIL
jgi:hypothetical protein